MSFIHSDFTNITGCTNSKKIYECIKTATNYYNFHALVRRVFLNTNFIVQSIMKNNRQQFLHLLQQLPFDKREIQIYRFEDASPKKLFIAPKIVFS